MTFLRRHSREVYRVYTEDEYLSGAGSEFTAADEQPVELAGQQGLVAAVPTLEPAEEWPVAGGFALESAPEPELEPEPWHEPIDEHVHGGFIHTGTRDMRLRRIAGLAMLTGAVGTVGALVAANISRTHRGAGKQPGSLVVARSSRVVSSPELAGSAGAPSGSAAAPQLTAPRSHVAQIRRRYAVAGNHLHAGESGSDSHPPTATHPPDVRRRNVSTPKPAEVGVKHGGGARIILDYSPGVAVDGSTVASSSVEVSRPPMARAAVEHAEFGFER
jgi:hypothetical protein